MSSFPWRTCLNLITATMITGITDFRAACLAQSKAGLVLPPISIEERLLDLDDDGDLEYIRSGGESLTAKYAKILWPRASEVLSE